MPLETLGPDVRPKVQNLTTENPETIRTGVFDPEKDIPKRVLEGAIQMIKNIGPTSSISIISMPDDIEGFISLFPNKKLNLKKSNPIKNRLIEDSTQAEGGWKHWPSLMTNRRTFNAMFPEEKIVMSDDDWNKIETKFRKERGWEGYMNQLAEIKMIDPKRFQKHEEELENNWPKIKENFIRRFKYVEDNLQRHNDFNKFGNELINIRICLPEKYSELSEIRDKLVAEAKISFTKNQRPKNAVFNRLIRTAYLMSVLTADKIEINKKGLITIPRKKSEQIPPSPKQREF